MSLWNQTGSADVANSILDSQLATLNDQTGTSYTLVATDINKTVTLSNAGAITLNVPANATVGFPIGAKIYGRQIGAGQVTITPAGGVTINAGGGGLKTLRQWSVFTLEKTSTDTWVAYGELTT